MHDNMPMRINRFIASGTELSRRAADAAVQDGRVQINGKPAELTAAVSTDDVVTLDGEVVHAADGTMTVLLNKPVGYVVSRDGQGSRTVYDFLPSEMRQLNPVGRLDKESSGLLLLTNDGELAHQLTHPSFQKIKVYEVMLDSALQPLHRQMIAEMGIQLEDGPSRLGLERIHDGDDTAWKVIMHEGRNRQIRRTFESLGYNVVRLHRTNFGNYALDGLATGKTRVVTQ